MRFLRFWFVDPENGARFFQAVQRSLAKFTVFVDAFTDASMCSVDCIVN